MVAHTRAPPPVPPPAPPPSASPTSSLPPQGGGGGGGGGQSPPLLQVLPSEVMIPPLLILMVASMTLTAVNVVFNVVAHRDSTVGETFQQWRRVLQMSKAAHIVEAPTAVQSHRMTQTHHTAAVTATTTPVSSPVELYSSAAFFRGIAAPATADAAGSTSTDVFLVRCTGRESPGPALRARPASPERRGSDTRVETAVYHEEDPPAAVPAPVVAEALTNTMEAVRLESQRVIFEFHPYYIILCAAKAFVMLIYIQYHFGNIAGGWRRFCVCGAANIFSGLLTPVWEYAVMLLLPLDLDRDTAVVVVKEEEEKADSVFIVELLLRIGSLELDDLPTVLMQGSSFVVCAAVLIPLLGAFCVAAAVRYLWIYVPLWLVYMVVRHVYYTGAGSLPSPTTRNTAAVVGMTNEMLKAFLMKSLTLFVLLFTVQSSFLLGLAWAEGTSYDGGIDYMVDNQVGLRTAAFSSAFQKVCLLSQLFL
ncbi:hypothetical protein NESM_000245600 [Novymonas esmeraldas]|uniref:Uncharacterized protein n=1 Tax=Novymonas esmeraldas TaxID=1808958 RepID=A0AAW0FCB8_9TRYP